VSGAANDLEQDRLLLRTFNEYCKANKQERALEVAADLHLVQCLEGGCTHMQLLGAADCRLGILYSCCEHADVSSICVDTAACGCD
jgi:hypothetical protein